MFPPIISFIIIEYHSLKDIKDCILSIKNECQDIHYEIIISSNSCYAEEKQYDLVLNIPEVRWCFNKKNGGFAYAMNQGLKIAHGKYMAIVNPDVRMDNGLNDMIQFMQSHPFVGAIAPRIVNQEGVIQDSARSYVCLQGYVWRCIKRILGHKSAILDASIDYSKVQTVDWVIGAFIMVRREVYEKTLGMDEYYFMYAEDLDWCTRIRSVGYEIVYYPLARVIYEGSRSARHSLKYAKIFFKSHIYYWRKFGFTGGYPKRKRMYFNN